MEQSIFSDRTIIVGSGFAGLYTALWLTPIPVLIVTAEGVGEGTSSALAQGGVSVAIGSGDSPAQHALDTKNAGAGIVDTNTVQDARRHVDILQALGTPFDRNSEGRPKAAAHSLARVVRVACNRSGRGIMQTLIFQIKNKPSIEIVEQMTGVELEVQAGSVVGKWVEETRGYPGRRKLLAGRSLYWLVEARRVGLRTPPTLWEIQPGDGYGGSNRRNSHEDGEVRRQSIQ